MFLKRICHLRAQGSKGYIIEFSWYFPEKGIIGTQRQKMDIL